MPCTTNRGPEQISVGLLQLRCLTACRAVRSFPVLLVYLCAAERGSAVPLKSPKKMLWPPTRPRYVSSCKEPSLFTISHPREAACSSSRPQPGAKTFGGLDGGGRVGGSASKPLGSPWRGGGAVGTPTYIPQNDTHDALIILNIRKWGEKNFQKKICPITQAPSARIRPRSKGGVPKFLCVWGHLKRSARAVQLFGRLAVLEAHALRY